MPRFFENVLASGGRAVCAEYEGKGDAFELQEGRA